ncbi:hypothetical protein OUZ56_003106 [Daphnia magna]|uniref:Uncharacterized protein n=1 Tax=Daphnia magna TaxID=35525 RepID=A0ABR0A7S0_9CRUS|nr:hypothetical protein OUZ56_003106 [Daphnia magna]
MDFLPQFEARCAAITDLPQTTNEIKLAFDGRSTRGSKKQADIRRMCAKGLRESIFVDICGEPK